MAGQLTVNKIKSRTSTGKWFTAEIEAIQVIRGQIYFIPKNKKYEHLKLTASNCTILS